MCEQDRNAFRRPSCVIDGETNPRVLELHKVGEVQIVLCRNCHARLLALCQTPPEQIWDPPDELERIARTFLAEADLFALLAQSRQQLAHALVDRVRQDVPINAEYPDATSEKTDPSR